MKDLIGGIFGSLFGVVLFVMYIGSIPFGLYYSFINHNILSALCSFFIPMYGAIYTIICWAS